MTITESQEFINMGPPKQHKWAGITESDAPTAQKLQSGRYTISVEGAFGGATIGINYGQSSGNAAVIDATNLSFTANGSYNIQIATGYILPTISGGSSTNVTVYATPIREG